MADDHEDRPVKIADIEKPAERRRRAEILKLRSRMRKVESGTPTPENLGEIFQGVLDGGVGSADPLFALAADMERRDGHYRGQLSVRKLAVGSVGTALRPNDNEAALELCQRVRDADWFGRFNFDLLDGLGKGWSINELQWSTGDLWYPTGYTHRDPRHFHWDRVFWERDPEQPGRVRPLPAYVYAIHEPHLISGPPQQRGLAWTCAFYSMAKFFSLKDWLALSEIFGIPMRIGEYPANATPDEKDALEDVVLGLGQEAAGIIAAGTKIMIEGAATAGASAEKLFQTMTEVANSEMSKAISGQTMTMDDGSSRSQSETHKATLDAHDEVTAKGLVATVNRDVFIPMQILNWGERPGQDYVELYVPEREDEILKDLVDALVPLIDRGFRVTEKQIRDKFGLTEPEDGDELLKPLSVVEAEAEPAADEG